MKTKKLVEAQKKLSERVNTEDSFSKSDIVGGVDQAFPQDSIVSGLVAMDSSFKILEKKNAASEATFPYRSGLLAFREAPCIFKVWQKLSTNVDLLLVDGHGIAHPRRLGLASHVGVVLDVPTIGVAKNPLVGDFQEPQEVGGAEDIRLDGETIGKVLKSKDGCNPIFISPGHGVSVDTSLSIVKKYLSDHKLPEPIYRADRYVGSIKITD